MVITKEVLHETHAAVLPSAKKFEATTVQAAIAATAARADIGCIVHGNSYRNPNLMADVSSSA